MHTKSATKRANAVILLLACTGCVHSLKLETPKCSNPVPITGHFDHRAPSIWTTIADRQVAADVARDYGLKLPFEGSTVITFPTTIVPAVLAKMRCDDRIPSLNYDAFMKNVLAGPRAYLTPRSSRLADDEVPSANVGARPAQLNR